MDEENNKKQKPKNGYTPISEEKAKKIRWILFGVLTVVAIVIVALKIAGVF